MTDTHDTPSDFTVYTVDLSTGERVEEPPPDLDTPTMEGPTEGSPEEWRRAYVNDAGAIEVDVFDGPIEESALPIAEVIARNVERLREKLGWSQGVAWKRLVKMSRSTQFRGSNVIQRIESGRRAVRAEDLYWLCDLFGVAVWELLLPPMDQHLQRGRTILGRDGASELLFHIPGGAIDNEADRLRTGHEHRIEKRRAMLKDLELDQVRALLDTPAEPFGDASQQPGGDT